eukprot:Pgem_evm1s16850
MLSKKHYVSNYTKHAVPYEKNKKESKKSLIPRGIEDMNKSVDGLPQYCTEYSEEIYEYMRELE